MKTSFLSLFTLLVMLLFAVLDCDPSSPFDEQNDKAAFKETIGAEDLPKQQSTTDFKSGKIESVINFSGSSPAGLVFDGNSIWIGDVSTNKIHKIDKDTGSIKTSFNLPESDLLDLAYASGNLFLSFKSQNIYEMNPNNGDTKKILTNLSSLYGVTFDGEYLITWEGGFLKRRSVTNYNSIYITSIYGSGDRLSHSKGNFFTVIGTKNPSGSLFLVEVKILDAIGLSSATEKRVIEIPSDISVVTGIESNADILWITGTGYGKNANKIVKVRLQ